MYDEPAGQLKNHPIHLPGLIVVDGPIGAGKTTFIAHLANALKQSGARVKVIDEAIPENLGEYYKDPARNVFAFQKDYVLRLFDGWADLYRQATTPFREHDFVICDRYWASTRAFVRYHYDKGNISDDELHQLTDIINLFITLCPMFPEYHVFLDEPNARCLERIKKRGRDGETEVGDAYMSEINEYIRRFNFHPFFGEGIHNGLLEIADKRAAAQQVKGLIFTDVEENTTKCRVLPELIPVDFAAELIKANSFNLHTRSFLMEEALMVATTGKSGVDVLRVSEIRESK
ncbi:Deoxynucleoside kinase [Giardia duodenalis]|uniref:Deoxynucleoside kinase n=1 Tax=Giardia intestinalis TaxID=5741 RepID=V6TR80_GIAIN|nr:Deoxynucleoside kinase [Giardia intestinalis]